MALSGKYGRLDIPGIEDDEPVFILRGKDTMTAPMIERYRNAAIGAGCPEEHLQGVADAREVVESWQLANAEKVRIPD